MRLPVYWSMCCAIALSGCASCQPEQPVTGFASPMAAPQGTSAAEACPAVSMGWKTVSFRIPTPKLLAVPKPQRGPQLVGVPIMPATAPMTVAQPMGVQQQVVQPQYVQVQPQAAPQGQPAPAAPQGEPAPQKAAPQSAPGCGEGCNSSQAQISSECDALMQDISRLQRQISIQAGNGKACVAAAE